MRISFLGKNLKGCFELTCPYGRRVTSNLLLAVAQPVTRYYVGADSQCRTVTVLGCRIASHECRGGYLHQ